MKSVTAFVVDKRSGIVNLWDDVYELQEDQILVELELEIPDALFDPYKLKVTIPAKTVTIDKCYHTCPYFTTEGGPGPVMVCNHPYFDDKESYDNYIISHPKCDTGFPDKCPLLKK